MEEIDFRNSFLVLGLEGKNSWRTNIQSVLLKYDQDKVSYSYLAKECRAEHINENPFLDIGRYESVRIITYKGIYHLQTGYRSHSLKENKNIDKFHQFIGDSGDLIFHKKCAIEDLNYDDVLVILRQNLNINIYLKVNYEFQTKKYSIITKCDFLNFPGENNNEENYIQPTCGHILFEKDAKFFIGFLAKHIKPTEDTALDFILRSKTEILDPRFESNKIKKVLKNIFSLLFDYVPDDFCEYVSVNNSEVKFFKYKI